MIAQVPGSDGERLRTSNSLLVDSTFFSMFTWSFTEGDPTTVMHTKQDVVLSETFARKLFGDEPAMGKNVNINGNDEYRVSGVIRDIEDSHFNNADIFMPFANLGDFWGQSILTEFNANSFMIYVLARPNADLPAKAPDLEAHFHELDYWLFSDKIFHTAEFKPLAELYYSPGGNGETRANDRTFLTVLAVTALVILIFAVINYINLSVAQTGFRAGEAAMRRLLGGSRRQLIVGLITESVLLCALSLVVALGLASVVEPLFQQMFATASANRYGGGAHGPEYRPDGGRGSGVRRDLGLGTGAHHHQLCAHRRGEGHLPLPYQNGIQQGAHHIPVCHHYCADRLYDRHRAAGELHDPQRHGI